MDHATAVVVTVLEDTVKTLGARVDALEHVVAALAEFIAPKPFPVAMDVASVLARSRRAALDAVIADARKR
jgi:hypothetical protein